MRKARSRLAIIHFNITRGKRKRQICFTRSCNCWGCLWSLRSILQRNNETNTDENGLVSFRRANYFEQNMVKNGSLARALPSTMKVDASYMTRYATGNRSLLVVYMAGRTLWVQQLELHAIHLNHI